MIDLILIRLLPTEPRTAADFHQDLQGLVVTAYDLTIDGPVNEGTLLGSAAGVIPLQPVDADLNLVHGASENFPVTLRRLTPEDPTPRIINSIIQHFYQRTNSTTLVYAAVATAVVVVDIDPETHPEFPTKTSYDLRIELERNGVKLSDPPIVFNISVMEVEKLSPFQWNYTGVDTTSWTTGSTWTIVNGYKPASTPAAYASIPPAPPADTEELASINIVNGQPPNFDALVLAVNQVLKLEHPVVDTTPVTLETANPLTPPECQYIASEISWNRTLYPYPTPKGSGLTLEDMYSVGAKESYYAGSRDVASRLQQQWEGSLSAYNSTRDADALILSNFIFAASAAIYAEKQSIAASTAALTFPIEGSYQTAPKNSSPALAPTVKTLSVILQGISPSFVVPAAYFYALSTNQAVQISPDTRYSNALNNSDTKLLASLQSAVDSGLLKTSESPATTTGSGINIAQAARRLVALGNTSGPLQNIPGDKASNILNKWLAYNGATTDMDGFWAKLAPEGDYLNLVLQILSSGDQPLIDAITATFGSAPVTSNTPSTPPPKKILTIDLLLKGLTEPSLWTQMFTQDSGLLPAWTLPGTTDQRTKAYLQYVQTILAVNPSPAPSPSRHPNDIPVLQVSEQDALGRFFADYQSDQKVGIDFTQKKLNETAITSVLSNMTPSNAKLQEWVKNAINIIHTLFQLTSFETVSDLQFSYMEALYSRGLTSFDRIALLTFSQFKAALHGTVAFAAASSIWKAVPTNSESVVKQSTGFAPVNDGTLTNCVPPENLSPFGRIRYLQELLNLKVGDKTLESIVSSRRGSLGDLNANLSNLKLKVPKIDLVIESLEKMGSNLGAPGAVYDTEGTFIPKVDKEALLSAIPEYSSPAIPVKSPSIYTILNGDMTAPNLPYAQGLDICRTYLKFMGTSRFETMRHFRADITELALDPMHEPSDFDRRRWRLPVRLDIAIEYLGISASELRFYGTPFKPETVPSLYGFNTEENCTDIVLVVPTFLSRTGLTYSEFLRLWKCGYIPFSPGKGDYPICEPCDANALKIVFPDPNLLLQLWKLAVFIRFWRQVRGHHKTVSFSLFADICRTLHLFNGDDINPDFVRQMVSLFMLRDLFQLPFSHQGKGLLTLWSPTATSDESTIELLLSHIQKYAKTLYGCPINADVKVTVVSHLKSLSRLVGFPDAHDWNSNPTCTLRFAEILAKVFAANCTVDQLLFFFTVDETPSPFPLSSKPHMMEDPLHCPEHCEEDLWKLRHKLLSAQVSDETVHEWTWHRIENTLRGELGWVHDDSNSDPLLQLGEHFFPSILIEHGYRVPKETTLFRTKLPADCTVPSGWQAPPYGPFRYHSTSSELVVEVPCRDKDVFEQLLKIHQLKPVEQQAVKDLYYAPRLAIVPFALIFSNFAEASEQLVQERDEMHRFAFFQQQFALFYRRCQIIAEHLASHVASINHAKENVAAAWQVLKQLIADENTSVSWENDSGVPPADFKWNRHLTGGAFAALLGLTGTGLRGEYKVGNTVRWSEIRAPMRAFDNRRNEENVPVPMIIPDLAIKTTSQQEHYVTFHNGFGIGEESTHQLGGVESFQVHWTGTLLIERHGAYKFTATQPRSCDDSCTVVLERGGKVWTVARLKEEIEPNWLHRGTYEISIHYKSKDLKFEGEVHRAHTGIQINYRGPDTADETCTLPLDKLFIQCKDGPMAVESKGTAEEYVKRYYPTLRDIRRTYQRAFKAILFTQTFHLSTRNDLSHHQSELGYLMSEPEQFQGTSYYQLPDGTWHSHHSYFNFNFLTITDPYFPPAAANDQRVFPSPQRTAALFDLWERIFDYTCLRKAQEFHKRREPLWLLFHEANEQLPVNALLRRLGVGTKTASIVVTYLKHTVESNNLQNEIWATRVWKSHLWIDKLQQRFFTRSLHEARPDLWVSDDPNANDKGSGNENLTCFVQKSCIQDGTVPQFDDIQTLNDGLRERARTALISWLCGMQRVPTVTTPEQLSSLLLQDVQVGLYERSSRIEDAIISVQTFVQRARIGVEKPTISGEFVKLWEQQFASFKEWEKHERRSLYKENWIQWEEYEIARKSEAFRFFERQLKRHTHTLPVSDDFLPFESTHPPLPLESWQSANYTSLNTTDTCSVNQAVTLLAQPEQYGQPSLLASMNLPDTPVDIFSSQSPVEVPLWFQGAIRLGTSFMRIAAAAIPPSGQPVVMDEYYFWIVEGKRFSEWDMVQNADIGTDSSNPSASNWDPPTTEGGTDNLPTLLHWKARSRCHLFWTRIHLGVFQPPRRSEQGVPLGSTYNPKLTFTGRTFDSLNFTIEGMQGFRYDIATDSAIVIPQAVPDNNPVLPLPAALTAFPYFVYFEPGAPLVPTSPFCTTIAIANTFRSQGRFEDALNWYRAAFDPLHSSNSWAGIDPRPQSVLLEYIALLLDWGTNLQGQNTIESSERAIVLFNETARLLGPQPRQSTDADVTATVANLKASSAPLNPRLLILYERLSSLRAIQNLPRDEADGVIARFPYRFTSLLPKALEITGLVTSLGNDLLSAYEKGDAEYLDNLRTTNERQLLDLGLEIKQRQWQDADWELQALQESMASALTTSRYYQNLISVGLISDEKNYVSSTNSGLIYEQGASEADAVGQLMNVIPDMFWGWAGLGPYDANQIPVGTKLGDLFAAEARVLSFLGELSNTEAGLSLTNAEWVRRAAEWQHELNVITLEIAQIKRQILAAERRREVALKELNNYQQEVEQTAEVQNFVRDKFTKQELYLFLQQRTATLYRQAYDLAFQTSQKVQDAFVFEVGVNADLPDPGWNNFREGLTIGQTLELALQSMERKYMELNTREFELSKNVSLRLDIPFAFLQLKTVGWCEIDMPEWMFDLDYPGQYMRRIKSVSLTLPCVVGPYVGVHCRLKLVSSSTRTDTSNHMVHRLGTEAIATSSGQSDSGLFQLSFQDERYIPFEYSGVISRWRIELPPENNQFDLGTLTDVVMQINYTAREGDAPSRKMAQERVKHRLPGNGIRLFDMFQEFPSDLFHKSAFDLPLRFTRNHFPFLTGNRSITIVQMEIFIEPFEPVEVGQHIQLVFVHEGHERPVDCVVSASTPMYHGSFQTNLGPITRGSTFVGRLRVPVGDIHQFYILCHYTAPAR